MAVGGGTEMAVVAHPVEKMSDSIQKLKIDTPKSVGSKLQTIGFMENSGDVRGFPVTIDPCHAIGTYKLPVESAVYYTGNEYAGPHGYVYDYSHGFEPTVTGEWIEYPCCIGIDGVEIHNSFPYSENGSVLYHPAGLSYPAQPVYIPYSTAPMATIGADGHIYAPQAFQYPEPIYQQALSSAPQYFPSTVMVTGDATTRESLPDNSCGMISYGNVMTIEARPTYPVVMLPPQNSYIGGAIPFGIPNPTLQDVRPSFDGFRPISTWPDISKSGQLIPGNLGVMHTVVPQPASGPGMTPQNIRSTNKPVQVYAPIPQSPRIPARVTSPRIGPGLLGRGYVPLSREVPNPNTAQKIGLLDVESSVNGNAHILTAMESSLQVTTMNPSSNGNGYNSDILNEQNRGPRTTKMRIQGSSPVIFRHLKVQNGRLQGIKDGNETFAQKQYNQPDFVTSYSDAKFFVIKSYSEDDVHKSIKYDIWTSTPNGNKRLEAAYQEALTRAVGKKGDCPVFLLFSVNASGQFCGLAEMVGSIDFTKSVDYWQQDKWSGQFAVKWHIVKDIPNSQFRHIILENNENKPVTNSRDTQEVKFEKGMAMLNIFKNYPLRSCILDDFQFYENRQKSMQEKRTVTQQQQQVLDQGMNEQQKLDNALTNVIAEQNGENVANGKCSSCGSASPDGTVSGQSDSN